MVSVDFAFDDDLQKELRYIDRNLVNKATVRALKSIAKPVLNTVKDYVPIDTHQLQIDIGMTGFINNKNKDVAVVHVGLSKKNHPKWLIVRGLAMEYGNEHVAARPFLSRAATQHRKPVYDDFRRFMKSHLDKLL